MLRQNYSREIFILHFCSVHYQTIGPLLSFFKTGFIKVNNSPMGIFTSEKHNIFLERSKKSEVFNAAYK